MIDNPKLMMQVCNQSRSQRHSSFFPSGRTFQVISNRSFHSKEKIFIRNEVNRQCLGYSSIDQLRHGLIASSLNSIIFFLIQFSRCCCVRPRYTSSMVLHLYSVVVGPRSNIQQTRVSRQSVLSPPPPDACQ